MKRILTHISLSLTTLLLTFGILETTARLWKWEWRLANFLVAELRYVREAYPARYDAELGWIPRPGSWPEGALWGKKVTITADGLRSNGREQEQGDLPDSPLVIAAGDSFTFGDEVSDRETWPAALEQLLGTPVINAGVFGYGFDQTCLRAKALIGKYAPDLVILSLISDDVRRCELSQRSGAGKPYFQIEEGRLQLHNQPVPPPTGLDLGTFKEVTGYSFFFYKLMRKAFPSYWLEGSLSRTVNTRGEEIACLLVRQMAGIANQRAIHLVLLIQYEKNPSSSSLEVIARLLHCVRSERVQVVDLREDLMAIKRRDPKEYARLFTTHMTARGNQLVARALQEALRESAHSRDPRE